MPYSSQPRSAFWRTCRGSEDFLSQDLFRPEHLLQTGDRIATAGSCFAQNIGAYIRQSSLEFVDTEPAPHGLAPETAKGFGYGLFSARYGNIYTSRQLRQLLSDCVTGDVHEAAIWKQDGRFFDGLRPGTEPEGYTDVSELKAHRRDHLFRVREIFEQADVFVFTLGLTEVWQDRASGVVFPSAPGVVAGHYDTNQHACINLNYNDVLEDMKFVLELMREFSSDIRVLLTVSPVPLTATAGQDHVLAATTYSKSLLRAVAGELATTCPGVEYFPSYEMITAAPFAATSYETNLRSVRRSAVDRVMSVFFGAYDGIDKPDMTKPAAIAPMDVNEMDDADALICEELLLDVFADK